MSLIVEDGTGLSTANSYVSVLDCDSYHLMRNNTQWADATTVQKEAALIKASYYVDGKYGKYYSGTRCNVDQSFLYPRYDSYDIDGFLIDGIPQSLINATCEAALIALSEDLFPSLERGGMMESVKVGGIEQKFMSNAITTTVYQSVSMQMIRLIGINRSILIIERT